MPFYMRRTYVMNWKRVRFTYINAFKGFVVQKINIPVIKKYSEWQIKNKNFTAKLGETLLLYLFESSV